MPSSNWLLNSAEALLREPGVREPGPPALTIPSTPKQGMLDQREILRTLEAFCDWQPDRERIQADCILL